VKQVYADAKTRKDAADKANAAAARANTAWNEVTDALRKTTSGRDAVEKLKTGKDALITANAGLALTPDNIKTQQTLGNTIDQALTDANTRLNAVTGLNQDAEATAQAADAAALIPDATSAEANASKAEQHVVAANTLVQEVDVIRATARTKFNELDALYQNARVASGAITAQVAANADAAAAEAQAALDEANQAVQAFQTQKQEIARLAASIDAQRQTLQNARIALTITKRALTDATTQRRKARQDVADLVTALAAADQATRDVDDASRRANAVTQMPDADQRAINDVGTVDNLQQTTLAELATLQQGVDNARANFGSVENEFFGLVLESFRQDVAGSKTALRTNANDLIKRAKDAKVETDNSDRDEQILQLTEDALALVNDAEVNATKITTDYANFITAAEQARDALQQPQQAPIQQLIDDAGQDVTTTVATLRDDLLAPLTNADFYAELVKLRDKRDAIDAEFKDPSYGAGSTVVTQLGLQAAALRLMTAAVDYVSWFTPEGAYDEHENQKTGINAALALVQQKMRAEPFMQVSLDPAASQLDYRDALRNLLGVRQAANAIDRTALTTHYPDAVNDFFARAGARFEELLPNLAPEITDIGTKAAEDSVVDLTELRDEITELQRLVRVARPAAQRRAPAVLIAPQPEEPVVASRFALSAEDSKRVAAARRRLDETMRAFETQVQAKQQRMLVALSPAVIASNARISAENRARRPRTTVRVQGLVSSFGV
jgi:hypothetical protein